MSYLVHLQQFEGPLGLLLYLIRKEEMDVLDIDVTQIVRQYLEYIRMMKELDLELAAEFVAMAATLIHIKSRMLLPQYDEEGLPVEVEDPRKELVQKLLEYQKFQDAAKQLYARPLLGRDVYARGVREEFRDEESLMAVITEDDGLFSLIAAYRRVVRFAQRSTHQVRPNVQSISSRLMEIKERLVVGSRVLLRDLLGGGIATSRRTQLLVTFLSILELGRMGFISVFQADDYGDIHVETLKPIERNVLERVQEFETIDPEAVARSLINEAIEERIDMQEVMTTDGEPSQMSLVSASALTTELEETINPDDMASDDEILAAEAELAASNPNEVIAAQELAIEARDADVEG